MAAKKWSDLRNFLPDTFHNQAKKVSKVKKKKKKIL